MINNLDRKSHISELYDLSHKNDKEIHIGYDYKNNLLKNSLSKQLFKNDDLYKFLNHIQSMMVCMFESNMILRNWFNHNVPKWYDRHVN